MMLGKLMRASNALRVPLMPMRRFADANAGTIDVNMSQGQATQYSPDKDKQQGQDQGHKEQDQGQKQMQSQQRDQRGVGQRKQRRRNEGMSLFDGSGSWLPSLFRAPHLFDLFNASEFPLLSEQRAFSNMSPSVDVYETDKEFKIDLEIPGLKKEDLKIRLEDDYLTISGERSFEKTDSDKKHRYRRMERSYGSFTRSFELPEGIDTSKIEANYDNGVLKVSVPKPEHTEEGRQIEIKEIRA